MKNILCSSCFKGLSLAALALATISTTSVCLTSCGGGSGSGSNTDDMKAAKKYADRTVVLYGNTQMTIEFGDVLNKYTAAVDITFGWDGHTNYDGTVFFSNTSGADDNMVTTIKITPSGDSHTKEENFFAFYGLRTDLEVLTMTDFGFTLTMANAKGGTWKAVEPKSATAVDSDGAETYAADDTTATDSTTTDTTDDDTEEEKTASTLMEVIGNCTGNFVIDD